ncbi:MAG: glycosyltransferase [Acidimicrobiales bacterium]
MRVVVVHNRYRSAAPSGENRVADQESAALQAHGHEVERFERLSDDIGTWSPLRRSLVPLNVIWNGEPRRSLIELLRRFRPDVVQVHNTFPLISPSVLYACRDEHVPVVATIHNYKLLCASGDLFRDGAPCHDCVGRRLPTPAVAHSCYRGSATATLPIVASIVVHRRAWRELVSGYVFLSEAQRRIFAALDLPAQRTFVKANLVPRGASAGVPKEHLVAYLGRLDAAKGLPLLMAAWDHFESQPTQGLRLVIAGSGPLENQVSEWAASRPAVAVVGKLSPSDCSRLVERSRAVVLPSQWEETFGLVAVEAMAAGVPAVAPAHGSFPELIGVGGILFEPGRADALSEALQVVDTDPSRLEGLGLTARQIYEERFDPEVNLQQLLDIYRFAIEHPVVRAEG